MFYFPIFLPHHPPICMSLIRKVESLVFHDMWRKQNKHSTFFVTLLWTMSSAEGEKGS